MEALTKLILFLAMAKRILVVDDEEDLVELLRVNLVQAGYEVEIAYSGAVALAKLEQSPPDLLVRSKR